MCLSTCKIIGKPVFGVVVHVCVVEFVGEVVSGMVSKVLLMSIVMRIARCGGFLSLMPYLVHVVLGQLLMCLWSESYVVWI